MLNDAADDVMMITMMIVMKAKRVTVTVLMRIMAILK